MHAARLQEKLTTVREGEAAKEKREEGALSRGGGASQDEHNHALRVKRHNKTRMKLRQARIDRLTDTNKANPT